MTIYTSKSGEKKDPSTVPPPEVVVETEAEKKENEANLVVANLAANPPTLITVSARPRRSGCANVCVLLTALIVVAIGVIGGIYLYKHLAQRTFRGWCGVKYYEYRDEERRADRLQGHHQGGLYHNSRRYYGQFEERVEIDKVNGKYEKIDVPDLDECRRATIIHDFERNLTAIVDKVNFHCFILPLNRSTVTPPRDFWDLLNKLSNGYYLPDAELVREHYSVVYPRIINLGPYGYHIWRECHRFDTYHLERAEHTPPQPRFRRAAEDNIPSIEDLESERYDTMSESDDLMSEHDLKSRRVSKLRNRKLKEGAEESSHSKEEKEEEENRRGNKILRDRAPKYNLGVTGTKWDRMIIINNLKERVKESIRKGHREQHAHKSWRKSHGSLKEEQSDELSKGPSKW